MGGLLHQAAERRHFDSPTRENIMRHWRNPLRHAQFAPILPWSPNRGASMERELWSELTRRIDEVDAAWVDPPRLTHRTAAVVRVYLWAALHDRPVCWACDADH